MTEEEKSIKDIKAIKSIISSYTQNEKVIVDQLFFKFELATTIGGFRKDIWKSMFEQIIPKKFVIEQSVFIIDSKGETSEEVDLAIYDETYTPYIFRYGVIKFIPIEAVAVVIKCMNETQDIDLTHINDDMTNDDEMGTTEKWGKKFTAMTTSSKSYTRTATGILNPAALEDEPIEKGKEPTQTHTRPILILCSLENAVNSDNNATEKRKNEGVFDIIIEASKDHHKLDILYNEKHKNLQDWYLALNHVGNQNMDKINTGDVLESLELDEYQVNTTNKKESKQENVSLLSLNLQLNQLLMLINNPIPFPHIAYAKRFNNLDVKENITSHKPLEKDQSVQI